MASAVIQSLSMNRTAASKLLQRTAELIDEKQDRNARSRRSHRKRTLQKLHRLGVTVSTLPRCGWKGS